MALCTGNGEEHCCCVEGRVCEFLEEGTVPGRRWACGLLRELGEWGLVYTDDRYINSDIGKWFARIYSGYGCGHWPQAIEGAFGNCCRNWNWEGIE